MTKEKELDISMKCIKYMLFVANLMFGLVGFLLISTGATIKSIYTTLDNFLEEHFYGASDLAIAVGFITFFVALFGCIGAFRGSVCLINTYSLLLFCVLILELAVSITTYTLRSNIGHTVHNKMTETMAFYNTYSKSTWDIVQSDLECCGVDGPLDWLSYENKFNLTKVSDSRQTYLVPNTCCDNEKCVSTLALFKGGCYSKIVLIISESALLLGIAALCVSFIQILGIIFALLLAKSLRKLKTQILVEQTEARMNFYQQMAPPKIDEKLEKLETPVVPPVIPETKSSTA